MRGLESLGKLLDKLLGNVRKSVARRHDKLKEVIKKDEFTLEELRNALKAELRVMEAGLFSSLPSKRLKTNHIHIQWSQQCK